MSLVAVTAIGAGVSPSVAEQGGDPPGKPGVNPGYTSAGKQGFGTARSASSPLWFTLDRGGLSETYYPNLSTPASRLLQIVVTDGSTFAQRLSDVPARTEVIGPETPSYRQISTGNGWTATTTYTSDPQHASVLVDLELQSHSGKALQVYAVHEPTLSGKGGDDRGHSQDEALVASDGSAASAVVAQPGFTAKSSGYLGNSDGWTDLAVNKKLTAQHPEAGPGNIGQVGQLPIDGLGAGHAVVTVGYAANEGEALTAARSSSSAGFGAVARGFAQSWQPYLGSLKPPPAALADERQRSVYFSSLVTLAASEDKQNPGAFVASPTMPWAFGAEGGSYHLVWPRDLYQHATALLAAGDRDAASRAFDYLRRIQQPDGHLPQNTLTTGEPHWTAVQLDQTALPIVLAWQLGRTDPAALDSVRKAAEFMLHYSKDGYPAPYTEQERWENHAGYSPGTIASAVAGLVCAADMLEKAGDKPAADGYRKAADDWRSKIDGWTASSNGPHSPQPYYLRLTKDGKPNDGTRYAPGNNYPGDVDQRTQVDPSFLELTRLGVKRADDPVVRNSIAVVDKVLGQLTPAGQFWHRFTDDGYGEHEDGSPWSDGHGRTYGRLWPIFAGERGEYELVAGDAATARTRLAAMASTANEGLLLPEQVWDNHAPAGQGGIQPGTPTTSATPLAWTHAQYVRLAWSVDAGKPVEQPSVVADRYTR